MVGVRVAGDPAALAELKRIIEDMRLYLRKMHGRDRPAMKLG